MRQIKWSPVNTCACKFMVTFDEGAVILNECLTKCQSHSGMTDQEALDDIISQERARNLG